MKQNDFDFVKEKIENSGVNAPQDMGEDFVTQKLEGIVPDTSAEPKIVELKPKKRRYALASGLAAAFVAVVALSVFGVMHFSQQNVEKSKDTELKKRTAVSAAAAPTLSDNIPLRTFASYDELREQMKTVQDKYGANGYRYSGLDYMVMEDAADSNGSGSSGSSKGSSSGGSSQGVSSSVTNTSELTAGGSESYSETYKQVEGVDEADIVKTDGRYLYIVSHGDRDTVRIFSATEDPEEVAVIYPNDSENPTATPDEADHDDEDDDYSYVNELYVADNRLTVISGYEHYDYAYHWTELTKARVYDVSDIKDIRLTQQFTQSGSPTQSRRIGDMLYLVSQNTTYLDYYEDYRKFDVPVCYAGDEEKEIPIDCVYSVENPIDNSMLIVGGYDLSDGSDEIETTAIVGSVDDIYCNEDNLYIYTTEWNAYYVAYNYGVYEEDSNGSDIVPKFDPLKTGIYKVGLKGGISFDAYGQVEGRLDSSYSLDEKDGYLRVAATTEDKYYNESNRLYVLDSDLKEIGRVEDFAKTESIKAVRYVGDTAYVITYEQTDPLFVIDLSDPTDPQILGEVKIDGFSSMLVPIDENTVLGLGYHTEAASYTDMPVQRGFKLVLFDVSDKMNPKVLDEKIYRDHYSEVMSNPRALVYNPERGDYLIPLNFADYHLDDDRDYYMPDIRGGALNFKVENGKIVEIDHPEVNSSNDEADTISRCLYVGENIYLISEGYYQDIKVYTAKYR